jgi:hypothetical protein
MSEPPTVRLVVVDSATSAFAGDPQPVEIHHRGIWYSGELLGWRHESDGRVVARVRCVVDRLRHSAWKDLTELRLPDPARPPRKERFPALPLRQEEVVPEPEDDATRPHVLLAGLRSRPPKPDHAVAPPVTPQVPRERPQRLPLAPCSRTPVPEHDHRHWPRVERTAAELSGV